MNLLKNNGWKCLWRGHPAQPTDQLKPPRRASTALSKPQELIAYTYKMAYDMGVQDVCIQSYALGDGERGLAVDCWRAAWGRRRTLLYMQAHFAKEPRQPSEVWRHFNRLFLPQWDLDFMRPVLWKKLPIGGRMGHQVGSKKGLIPIMTQPRFSSTIGTQTRSAKFLTIKTVLRKTTVTLDPGA